MNRPPETAFAPPDLAPSSAHAVSILRACGLSESILKTAQNGREPREEASEADSLLDSPAVEWARSGAMHLSGAPDGPPQFAAGALASAARGVGLVLRALAPPNAFSALDAPALLGERAAIAGLTRGGDIACGGAARLFETRHGFIAAHLPRDEDWRSLPAWLECDDDPVWQTPLAAGDESRWHALASILRTRSSEGMIERGRLLGLAVAPAPRTIPAEATLFRSTHGTERRAFPLDARGERAARPLRLLDLSTLWAGPLAASLLAECGIEVLKIESPNRPDGARLGPPAFFDLMHQRKSGCAIDLRDVRDRSRFEALLEHADVVLESARPRALEQLGYDAASWVSAVPGRIWASITGYGRDDAGIAFGDDAAVAAGLAWAPRAEGTTAKRPTFCGDAIADPLTGMHTAALILGCLRSGRGGLLDIALRDVAAVAALAGSEGLTTPLRNRAGDWHLALPEGEVPVAAPRTRRAVSKAPALRAPSEALMRAWTQHC
jgi:hypothetical protein